MSTYKYNFISIYEYDHGVFMARLETAIAQGYFVLGSNVGITWEIVKWFPPKIVRAHYAFLQRTVTIESEDDKDE